MQLQKLMVKYTVVTRVTPYCQVRHHVVHKEVHILCVVGGKNSGEGERGKGKRACRVHSYLGISMSFAPLFRYIDRDDIKMVPGRVACC